MKCYLVNVIASDSDNNIIEQKLFSTEELAKKYQTLMKYKYCGYDITLEDIVVDEINPDDYKYYTLYKIYLKFPPTFGIFSEWDISHIGSYKNSCPKECIISEDLSFPDILRDKQAICLSSLDKQKIINTMAYLHNNFDELYVRSDTLGGYVRRDVKITQYYVRFNIQTKEYENFPSYKIEANGLNCSNENLFKGEVICTDYIEVYSTESLECAKKKAEEIYESLQRK